MKPILLLSMAMSVLIGCGTGDEENIISATGTIEAREVIVSSKVYGEVKKISFDEGAKVQNGDTIAIIDNETYVIQLRQAEANRIMAEAQYELLKNGARKEDITQAEELLKQAETSFRQAEIDKNRMHELYNSKSISKKQFEDSNTKYEVGLAQFNAAKENLSKMKNFARPEELKQAEARLKQSLANEELIRKNISDSYITSPINGVIVKKYVEIGENVTAMSSLFKAADLSTVELMIYVSEIQLGKVKLGQKAKITVDAFPEKSFDGSVIYISPEAEFTPKNIQTKDERTKQVFGVKIKIPNPNFELKTGMPADAEIIIN
ncbi:MAG: efflux RND transporter periplasmic adaptor subunit [Ignavibacteriaceae bacterium]|nr:efflux RND transporter periplasmic adaptor subunit [Ignavibacteriaceae bacterium]